MNSYLSFALIYAVSWWLMLFMVLPFGVAAPEAPEKNVYAAAPVKARIKQKLLITSAVALVPTLLLQWLIMSGLLRGLL